MEEETVDPYAQFPSFVVGPVFWFLDLFPASWATNCNHFKEAYPATVMLVASVSCILVWMYSFYLCTRQLLKVMASNNSVLRVLYEHIFGRGEASPKKTRGKEGSAGPTGTKQNEGKSGPSPGKPEAK